MKRYVIFSLEETLYDLNHEPLFWSNEDGWVSLATATIFTEEETEQNDGFLSFNKDTSFVQLPE